MRSLIDIEKGGQTVQNEEIKLWSTLIVFIFHIMFQHLQIYMYQQECEAWSKQDIKASLNKNLKKHEKHIRENCFVISGFNTNDNPKLIEQYLSSEINKLLEEDENEKLKEIKQTVRESCENLYKQSLKGKEYYHKPLYSIHVPGDFNSMSYLIDEY